MRRIGDFFKRIKVTEETKTSIENNNSQEIEIQIDGNINLFENEKRIIFRRKSCKRKLI